MRPRIYFVARACITIVSGVLIFLLSVGIANYILFSIRASHHTPLLSMGVQGIGLFLLFFPWWLLFFDVLCFAILQRMVQKFPIGYKNPLIYTLGVGIIGILGLAFVIDISRAGDRMLHQGHIRNMPLLFDAYEYAQSTSNPENGVCPCVVKVVGPTFVIMTETVQYGSGRDIPVLLPVNTATSSIHSGDTLFLIGEFNNGILYASKVQQWDPDQDNDMDTLPIPTAR